MGALIKFIFFFFVILWLISKVFGFVARVFLGKVAKQNGRRGFNYQKTYRSGDQRQSSTKKGNIHVDFVPKDKASKDVDFKGGDYVDYEEVK